MRAFKVCACGAEYSRAQWLAIPSLGRRMLGGALLDYRNCSCGSTMTVRVPAHFVSSVGGALRPSVCGELCRAGGPWEHEDGRVEEGIEFGTTRLLSVRCRACVAVLRAERNYLLAGKRDKYGRPAEVVERPLLTPIDPGESP